MTIAVAIRTGSAVVFAADSKVTTAGLEGFKDDGSPIWVDQTYDHATKVVHDLSKLVMAMVAGHVTVGQVSATDIICSRGFPWWNSVADQDRDIGSLVAELEQRKREYWQAKKVEGKDWPGPTLLVAAPGPDRLTPRVWRITLDGPGSNVTEILQQPGVRLEGAYDETYGLLYGFHAEVMYGAAKELSVDPHRLRDAVLHSKLLSPIDKVNFHAMPIQDAMDMAYFLATVQIEMDRFLPGTPACGGPVDVMVLQMAPQPQIVAYPGKTLHHPSSPR